MAGETETAWRNRLSRAILFNIYKRAPPYLCGRVLDSIPVCFFMPGDKKTALTADPALLDLAWLNKRHWQATCDQFALMEFARRPPWFGKCLGEFDAGANATKIVFGAGQLCHSTDPNAQLASIGIDPASVAAGNDELKDLENRMAIYGLQLLQPKTGMITATESKRDAEENNSSLKAWALQFQDFLENCLVYAARWWKLPDGPSVVVNVDFASAIDATLLMEMYRAQAISRETLLSLVKGLGVLPDDFQVEEEQARIEREIKGGDGPLGTLGGQLLNLASNDLP